MQKRYFQFNGLLKSNEIEGLYSLIGKSLTNISAEKGILSIDDNMKVKRIDTSGLCRFFFHSDNRDIYELSLLSLFKKPDFPMVEHGAVSIEITSIPHKPLKERLKESCDFFNFGLSLNVDIKNIVKIACWGNKQQGYINELDPYIDAIYLKNNFKIDYFPYANINSIEGVSFEGENNEKIILILQDSGFVVFFEKEKTSEDIVIENYLKINGYEKNIVLMHEIL